MRTCAYQVVRNVRFSENLMCFVFLLPLFCHLPFCLITVDLFFHQLGLVVLIKPAFFRKKFVQIIYFSNTMALSPNGEIGKCTIFMYHNISVNIITIQLLRVFRLAESSKIRKILVRVKRLLPLLLKNVFPNYQYKCSGQFENSYYTSFL